MIAKSTTKSKKASGRLPKNGEKYTKVVLFSNVLTHHFENIISQNVISDIYESAIIDFYSEYEEMLEKERLYSWPIHYENKQELFRYLEENDYRIFNIDSSIGLCGFVIAEQILIEDLN
jgi:hypothetical protein